VAQTAERAVEQETGQRNRKCLMAGAAVATLFAVITLMQLFLATLYIIPNWIEEYKSAIVPRMQPLLCYALSVAILICELKPSKRAADTR